MHVGNRVLVWVSAACIACFTSMAVADDGANKLKSPGGELNTLNARISGLSDQIVDRQQGLEDDLRALVEQRRALQELEKRVMIMIEDQEEKLISQRIAIQEAEKHLDRQKSAYLEQHRRLDQLRTSLKGETVRSDSSSVARIE